jgi:hypothetical protein
LVPLRSLRRTLRPSMLAEVANGSPIARPLRRRRIRTGDVVMVAVWGRFGLEVQVPRAERDGQIG